MAVIAISCAYDENKDRAMLHMGYIRSIVKAGGIPVMVHFDGMGYTLPKVDGLILSGGGDISPLFFSRKPTEKTGEIQLERDIFELSLIEQCMELPILGICRGMQVLNTAYDGTLLDHIEGHELRLSERHDVVIDEKSRLYSMISRKIYPVNSMHHQSVDRVGVGLNISAVSEDGTIEAVEHPERPHFGVQWHPEKMGDKASALLFSHFVSLCKKQSFSKT